MINAAYGSPSHLISLEKTTTLKAFVCIVYPSSYLIPRPLLRRKKNNTLITTKKSSKGGLVQTDGQTGRQPRRIVGDGTQQTPF